MELHTLLKELLVQAGEVIQNKPIQAPPLKWKSKKDKPYNPFYVLIWRDNEMMCVWTGDVKRPKKQESIKGKVFDIEIARYSDSIILSGFDDDWCNQLTLDIHRSLSPALKEKFGV